MRKRLAIIPIILLLAIACQKVNVDELNEQITTANSDYDSVNLYVAFELASIINFANSGGTLSDSQKQRAIDLYEVLGLLDTYRNTIQAMKIEPTTELLQQAAETWIQINEKATALGWTGGAQ